MNVAKGVIVSRGLECAVLVIVNLQLLLKNQSSVRIWKESGALITKNVEKGDIVLIMGLELVNVNLHPHLNLQNNAKNWKGHIVRMMMNVAKGAIVIIGIKSVGVNLNFAGNWKENFARMTM